MTTSIDQHLAWPETRIGYLLTWIDRPIPADGWNRPALMQLLYDYLAATEDYEGHF